MALLDLSIERTPETVKIDGVEYGLTPFESFSITDYHGFKAIGQRMKELGDKLAGDDVEESAVAEFEKLSDDQFMRVAGDIPDNIRSRISPLDRQRLVNAYFLSFGAFVEPPSKQASKNGRKKASRHSRGSTPAPGKKSG